MNDAASDAVTPRAHQIEAMEALDEVVATQSRAQLIMACGSGKTLIGRFYAERLQAGLTVVVVPSLGLVAQTLTEWRAAAGWAFQALITCSDPSTADGVSERAPEDGHDVAAPVWAHLRARVTTNAAVVARRLAERPASTPLVIFSTYHSVHVVAAAARSAKVVADLVIADEAHMLAGQPRAEFQVVLTDALPARTRVFMTATQVVSATSAGGGDRPAVPVLSMGDAELFGPVAYRLDFAEAINRGLLVDYQVLVYETPGQHLTPDPLAALAAAAERGVSSVLSFHGRVAKARAFADALDGVRLPDGRRVTARAVAGGDPASTRSAALALLNRPRPDELVVVSSARCLSAGINVPAVDGVLFADPKNSDVDVIQSVGRALRVAPGKRCGLVMIPVCVPAGLDDDTALSTGSFAAVWRILRGLRSMDRRLAVELNALVHNPSRSGVHDKTHVIPRILFDIASLADAAGLQARVVDLLSPVWDSTLREVEEFVAEHGHLRIPRGTRLGEWCERQRRAHRSGMLAPERVERLNAVADWAWDLAEQRWLQQWAQIREVADEKNGLDLDNPELAALALSTPEPRSRVNTVGRWCAHQRQLCRRGELSAWRHARLDEITGWTWSLLSDADGDGVDLLGEYVAWKGHANPPADVVEDGVPLGSWINNVRRRRVTGQMSHPLLDELAIVTPSSTEEGALHWYANATQWLLGLEALRQFVAREGHCRPPYSHYERLPDYTLPLYDWCTRQRHFYRHGKLIPARARMLERVAGWQWERQPAPRVLMDIGDSRHGTRTGYVKGCRCIPCTEANRVKEVERTAAAASGAPTTDLVDAAPARTHIEGLKQRGATMKQISRASGLNTKTIANVAAGETRRILPESHTAIMRVTLADVRSAAAPGTRVDAGPTWALLDDMIERGWPKSWIARELGWGASLQLSGDTVTASNADKVSALADRLGQRTPPPRRWRQSLPRLEELLIAEAQHTDVDDAAVEWARSLLAQGYQVERVAQRSGLDVRVIRQLLDDSDGRQRNAS